MEEESSGESDDLNGDQRIVEDGEKAFGTGEQEGRQVSSDFQVNR